ncbi:hypothetical protein EW146_g4243 [Bondarzewia mesenterica]|uniref:Uncharacterized protein n=1 Tax=Bondarzewia mesenterica TaxID=1095465 RepID=A0A4V3XF71_9AGAM|nr:hypothetical protein EW146_g4243 [Bondarzewia mesenterica]
MFGGFGSLNSVESEKRQALRDAYKTINEALNPRNPIRSTAFYVPGTDSMDDLRQRCALLESRIQCFTVQEAKVLSWGDTELLASWAQDIVENLLSNGVRQEHWVCETLPRVFDLIEDFNVENVDQSLLKASPITASSPSAIQIS